MEALAPEEQAHRIRLGKPEDVGYVIGNYRHGLQSALSTRRMHGDEFRARSREQIVRILERPATRLWVSCDLEDEDVILGFALVEGPCLHWVYVREHFRGQGIARTLIASIGGDVTTFSAWVATLKPEKLPGTWAYDPYAAVWPDWAASIPHRDSRMRRHSARALLEKVTK